MNYTLKRVFIMLTVLLVVIGSLSPLVSASEFDSLDSKTKLDLKHEVKLSEKDIEKQLIVEDQLEVLNGPATLSEELEDRTGKVNVIVHYREPSVGLSKGISESQGKKWSNLDADKVRQKIEKQQLQAEKSMRLKNINANKIRKFNLVINAEVMTVDAKDLHKLLELPEVALVEEDQLVTLDPEITENFVGDMSDSVAEEAISNPYIPSISHLGIDKVWEIGNKGEGIKVGVLDTGIDYNHPDLKDIYKGGRNYANGADYLNTRAADDPYETAPSERPSNLPEVNANGSEYYTTHGTHVAGTIAAQNKGKFGVIGISPNVELYAYRVLGAYGSGYTNWIVGGIEDAVKDGMDVINLSLGNSSPDEAQANSFAVNNAMLLGTVAVSATGNSGPNRSTVGSPASGAIGISVGNTTLPEEHWYGDVTLKAGDYKKELNDVLFMTFTLGEKPEDQLNDTEDVVVVPGVGDVKDFEGVDVKDKIALIQRGDIAFVQKVWNARDAGAKGAIIYNSESGSGSPGPYGTFLGQAFDYLPTLDLSFTDGKAFKEAIEKNDGTGTIDYRAFNSEVVAGDNVNDSSSRGPSKPNFDIKPDVTAPGTNILSTVPVFEEFDPEMDYTYAYAQYTGTSMATPHITAISALILELNPDYDAFDVKSALSNTAKLLDTSKFDVFAQGAGLVDPYRAATTDTLLKVEHETTMEGVSNLHTRGTMSFGVVSLGKDTTKELLIENRSGASTTYNFEVMPLVGADGVTITPSVSSLTTDGTATVNFTISVPEGITPGTEVQGYINVTSDQGNYQIPYAALLGKEVVKGIESIGLNDYHISPNSDGVLDQTVLTTVFGGKQDMTIFEYYDLLNPDAGSNGDGYVGTIAFEMGLEGKHELKVDGTMYNIEDGVRVPGEVADGVYTVDAFSIYSGSEYSSEYDGPIFIKREATNIEDISVTDTTVNLTVDDLYFNVREQLATMYNLEYDPNIFVKGKYTLADDETLSEGFLSIENDGSTSVDFKDVTGVKHLVFEFQDAAGNDANYEYTVNFDEGTIVEGLEELPENPEEPEEPEEPVSDAYELKLADLHAAIAGKDKTVVAKVPAEAVVDGSVDVKANKDVIDALLGMKHNKSFVLDVDGYSVILSPNHFKELQGLDSVTFNLSHVAGEYVSDVFTVKATGKVNGEITEVALSNFSVGLPATGNKYNVLFVDSGKVVKGNGLFDKKKGQLIVKNVNFGSYAVISQ